MDIFTTRICFKAFTRKNVTEADIVFWVGEDLENFLEKPLGSIAKKAENIELLEIKGLTKLKFKKEIY